MRNKNLMPYKKNYKVITIIILAVIAYLAYRVFMPHGGGMHAGMNDAAHVSVAETIERNIQEWNEFSGKLVAVDKVAIRPRVSGIIESVHFKDSAMVKKDALLFVIDTKPFTAELNRAEAALASAQTQVTLANSELARAQRLYKEKAIPQREYDERKNSANVAKANLESAHALLQTAKLNLEYTHVKSPIAGKIGRTEITVGNLVEAGSSAPILTTVVSNNPVYADFEVDEDTFLKYSNANATGNKELQQIPAIISVGNENSIAYNGHVESFDNSLDATSGTIRARAIIENTDGKLIPGLFARIKLGNAEKKPTILITDRAIGTDQNKKFVFVIDGENKAIYREIKLGPVSEGLRVIKEGLTVGEKIVVNGLQRVRPGQPIMPDMVSMDTGESLQLKDAPVVTNTTKSAK